MELKSYITLSKKHQRELRSFPYFFIPALNEFYFLRDDYGFRKPELDTWKNEANLIFTSKTLKILIEYEAPNWIDVKLKKIDQRGYVYWSYLVEELSLPSKVGLMKIEETKDMKRIQTQIARHLKDVGMVLKVNWQSITDYLLTTNFIFV
jgi:hypothetical protein